MLNTYIETPSPGLTVSDLGCLTTLIWTNICYTPAFSELDLPFDSIEFQYLTSGMPHATFARVTGWITALITLERCLCITAPLKVKRIITPKRVAIIIVSVYLILLSSVAPVYVVNKLDLKYFPARNRTIIGIVYMKDKKNVETISFTINNVFIPFSAFLVLVVCTVTLVIKLRIKTKWRKKSTTAQADNISNRNQKVAKMVVMIATLFIACYVPISIMFIGMLMVPDLSIGGKYRPLMIVIGGVGIVLESINSSVNIFVYYHMSSKYRSAFRHVFRMDQNRSDVSNKGNSNASFLYTSKTKILTTV